MGPRRERLTMLFARIRERRERAKSRRMALRLAVFLGAVIALPFAYWQYRLEQVIGPAATTEELAAKCDRLAETLQTLQRESGKPFAAGSKALDYRISECDEMGIDLTTGSIGEDDRM